MDRLRFSSSFSYENSRIIFQKKGLFSYISFTRAENKFYSIYFILKTCFLQTFSSSYRWHNFDNEANSRPTSGAFMYLHRRVLVFCMPLTCCSFFPDVELFSGSSAHTFLTQRTLFCPVSSHLDCALKQSMHFTNNVCRQQMFLYCKLPFCDL